ncbi:eukaryotic translation initiation factor 5B isoform X2 [Sorghum bicolor]|uniref:eukaryotic translation initiation factor 5B isoform X2 n=1 Tax=Sorghum bicolor TaxID=4558 RepID=UPI000B42402F|nr:eukaryotic translation initiation factor 5B isoform X2 [Sorghum bicolor]|eukprot:XP_021311049.1 eukaryotic translation initiation factor 5B isoform X2 [Sorghum bicolor]
MPEFNCAHPHLLTFKKLLHPNFCMPLSEPSKLEQGSEEQGNKDMDAFSSVMDKVKSHPEVMEKVSAVMDKVKSHPEVVEKVKDEVKSLADALHLRRHGKDKEPESEEKAEEGEVAQSVDESASADKTEEPNVLEQAVEEIQAVATALQQQAAPAAETETEIPVETAAAAETSAAGDKPEETNRGEVEKDDPKKRLDFAGFFAMLFERFCSPGNKKKD